MSITQPFNFEDLTLLIIAELQKSEKLSYVSDKAIVLVNHNNRDKLPEFTDYLVRISAPDSGFLTKQPRIGRYYRNIYSVAIDLWVKSSSPLAGRLTGGSGSIKGIYEFFQDISDTLEHNTLDNQLDSYPGSNISSPMPLESDSELIVGVGFIWVGNQDNFK